jgi:GNAT superfamily N-acetyltransferase
MGKRLFEGNSKKGPDPMSEPRTIRKATKRDLTSLKIWLQAEDQQRGRGFFCNWDNRIEPAFTNGGLFVLAVKSDILGFVVDAPRGADIVEVRPDIRGNGYGRELAAWLIEAARKRGNSVVELECSPPTSIPFWEKMGFTVSGRQAHMVLQRKVEFREGQRQHFQIDFYPKERDWNKKAQPFQTYSGEALLLKDRSLLLPERAICFTSDYKHNQECRVRIAVETAVLVEDKKLKEAEVESFGVRVDPGGIYFIERVFPNGSLSAFGGHRVTQV